jgi:hypothetical protein
MVSHFPEMNAQPGHWLHRGEQDPPQGNRGWGLGGLQGGLALTFGPGLSRYCVAFEELDHGCGYVYAAGLFEALYAW